MRDLIFASFLTKSYLKNLLSATKWKLLYVIHLGLCAKKNRNPTHQLAGEPRCMVSRQTQTFKFARVLISAKKLLKFLERNQNQLGLTRVSILNTLICEKFQGVRELSEWTQEFSVRERTVKKLEELHQLWIFCGINPVKKFFDKKHDLVYANWVKAYCSTIATCVLNIELVARVKD